MIKLGFSYGINPLTGYSTLCCDFCGKNTGEVGQNGERIKDVKKMACPFEYCQAWATCNQCRKLGRHKAESSTGFSLNFEEDKRLRKNHEGCKIANAEYLLREAEKKKLLDEGKYLRVSVMAHGDQCKVIFRNKDRQEKAFFMHSWVYGSIPLMKNATIEDYQQHGQLEECKNTRLSDGEKYRERKYLQLGDVKVEVMPDGSYRPMNQIGARTN